MRIGLRAEAAKRALDAMAADAPLFVNADELGRRTRQPALVLQLLFDLYCRNLLELAPRQPRFLLHAGPRPEAAALARWQCGSGPVVTNQRHQAVTLDEPLAARLLPLLDGAQERAALSARLGVDMPALEQVLDALGRQALLVG